MSNGLVVAVILIAIVLVVAEWALSIGGTIDALSRPRQVWAAAGCRKLVWVWQAVGVWLPVGLIYSGIYYVRIRPKLVVVQRALDDGAYEYLNEVGFLDGRGADEHELARHDHTVKVRASLILRLFALGPGVMGIAVWLSVRNGPHGDAFLAWWLPILSAIQFASLSWFGVNLTPTDAVVNSFQRRRVPWSRVQAVAQEPFLGGRRVVLWTDLGDRIPLRSPMVDFTSIGARKFDRDFHTVGRWWLQHRGPDWRPQPQ